jgi:uncharacterized DUF497 family protein
VIGFAFDPVKSDANQRKHGFDFLAAQALWRDPALLEIPARTTGEPRFLVIALLRGRHQGSLEVMQSSVPELVLASPAPPVNP